MLVFDFVRLSVRTPGKYSNVKFAVFGGGTDFADRG
jgi:hypothetical protein